jgi:AcrR family transcriptional regulator
MPKVSESHRQERRDQILRAAWRCYERQGFHRTSVRDICEEADLSVGAVYSYFDGKDEILAAVAEEGWSHSRSLVASVDGADDPREACVRFLERMLDGLDTDSGRRSARVDLRLRAECLDIEHLREQGREQLSAWRGALAEQLEPAGAGSGGPGQEAEGSAEDVADVLIALLAGTQTLTALDPERDPTAVLRGMRALLAGPATGRDAGSANGYDG